MGLHASIFHRKNIQKEREGTKPNVEFPHHPFWPKWTGFPSGTMVGGQSRNL